MDGDKELIDKLQHIWHSTRPFPQEPWDRIIALVREHDGRRWLQAIRKSMLENHFGTKCTLDTIADVRKRLDAIPQSADDPLAGVAPDIRRAAQPWIDASKRQAPAADTRYTMDHITWRAITEMCSVEQVNAISGRVLQLRWEQKGGA